MRYKYVQQEDGSVKKVTPTKAKPKKKAAPKKKGK